jgi:RNA polymerase-binding transcription factor DksA
MGVRRQTCSVAGLEGANHHKAKGVWHMATVQNNGTVIDVDAAKQRLLAEQERLEAELREIAERTSRPAEVEQASEISTYEDHAADLASETFEREKDLALESNIQDLLEKVTRALEKIEEDTYGICDYCGLPINIKRMDALPWASLCRDDQDRMEGR